MLGKRLAIIGTALLIAPALAGAAQNAVTRCCVATIVIDGVAYFIGGEDANHNPVTDILRYDPASGALEKVADLPEGRSEAAAFTNGKLTWILGGRSASGDLDTILQFDPTTMSVLPVPKKLLSRQSGLHAVWDPTDAPLSGCAQGCAYVFGSGIEILRFNPSTSALKPVAGQMPTPDDAGPAVFDGAAAFVYGEAGRILRFVPSTNALTTLVAPADYSSAGTSAVFDGRYSYLVGGDSKRILQHDTQSGVVRTMGAELSLATRSPGAAWLDNRIVSYNGVVESVDPLAARARAPLSVTMTVDVDDLVAHARATITGEPTSYSWDWGDGSVTHEAGDASHAYESYAPRVVRLTLTNAEGTIATATRSVTLVAPAPPPLAAAKLLVTGLTVTGDASSSTGQLLEWAWSWGDGATSAGARATHGYANPGEYQVTLRVRDDENRESSWSGLARVARDAAAPPHVSLKAIDLTARVDARASARASWLIDWGDGATSVDPFAEHAYAKAGSYVVSVRATLADGSTTWSNHTLRVNAPDSPPIADFRLIVDGLRVFGDASASRDPEGLPLAFAWSWGDGATDRGLAPVHDYASGGERVVTLSVTDARGASTTTTRVVKTEGPVDVAEAPARVALAEKTSEPVAELGAIRIVETSSATDASAAVRPQETKPVPTAWAAAIVALGLVALMRPRRVA